MKEKELIKSLLTDAYKMLRSYADEVPPTSEDTYWRSVEDLNIAIKSFEDLYNLLS